MYDSKKDTLEHMSIIHDVFNNVILKELEKESATHDLSKLQEPEKSCYDKYIPMLREAKYGTPEYYEIKKQMQKEGLDHHYEVNRHHPEHFPNGIRDMTLIDIMVAFADWYSASKKSDTGFEEGLKSNKERYNISDDLYQIMLNTYHTYFK